MNLGTGWPFGGPQITPEFAASRLFLQSYDLKRELPFERQIKIDQVDQNRRDAPLMALTAFYENGSNHNLFKNIDENDSISFSPEMNGKLIAAFCAKTRQLVKRSAPGGEGWAMDHFSSKALDQYLSRFSQAFDQVEHLPRAFFNDSYEVYGASTTEDFFEEFIG